MAHGNATNVALACTAGDSGTGLANPSDASFSLVTSVGAGIETANASTDSRVVCDVEGNCATAGPIAGNRIDRKAPAITVTTPAGGAVYPLKENVAADYGCADAGSGPSSCAGTVADGVAIDTSTTGTKTFVVNAADAVGNSSTATVTYTVKRMLTAVGPAKAWIGLPWCRCASKRAARVLAVGRTRALCASGTTAKPSTAAHSGTPAAASAGRSAARPESCTSGRCSCCCQTTVVCGCRSTPT